MIFSDVTIKEFIENGKIKILPTFDNKNIRPAGIRLHLGDELLVPVPNQIVDLSNSSDIKYEKIKINEEGYTLKPGEFVLGTTVESIHLSKDIVGKLDGRSTIARLGLLIHCSSDTIDGNHEHSRSITLELKNIGNFNLIIKPNIPIAMVVFHKLTEQIQQKNQTQYNNQTGVQPPNLSGQLQ
ncbi:dCTP deaminase [Candidatus Woesearchaeota archaeon]|jgi:dCTP deaminase|nr:dCTP deaminase [Candidatus Woesearchaeota archaeon]MBT4595751.1 dCTP deaminase [Candidatus Woesearchaeota archaeon]MBT5741400.1 dCTP deaminase [Candidatus Woesearchaeota archaeon]MBT6505222.1 dCTP deaminase [Candidatus Woesearchaeota archaeon]MBT7296094.1 dCTP deaminase [Candidatus Woesearchaeota archaeon]